MKGEKNKKQDLSVTFQHKILSHCCVLSPSHLEVSVILNTHSHVKLSSFVARLYLEDVEGAGVARGGLHLEDVCRHTAPRRQVHVSVQNSEGFVPAGRVLS